MRRALGFSAVPGRGGMAMGVVALVAAPLAAVQSRPQQWLIVWLIAAAAAFALGLGAIVLKLRRTSSRLLTPATTRFSRTLVPALAAGAVLTLVLVQRSEWEILPGVWLLLYGAGVTASGTVSTSLVSGLGLLLMGCGLAALVAPVLGDAMMGVGFGAGQLIFGAMIARRNDGRDTKR